MSQLKARLPRVAIVDYGMGNLFSVKHACLHVGLEPHITFLKDELHQADAVILPGVGAFGDAMETLRKLDLVSFLRDLAFSGKPFIGICLGHQLLMGGSHEFGWHEGLNIIKGSVVRFENHTDESGLLKVPQVGWNRISKASGLDAGVWEESPLKGIRGGEFMYFVHSFYAQPEDMKVVLSVSSYGGIEFCSSLRQGNIFGCQFHPERSGPAGLQIYYNIASYICQSLQK